MCVVCVYTYVCGTCVVCVCLSAHGVCVCVVCVYVCVCVCVCEVKWTHLNALTRWSDGSGGHPSNRVHSWSTVWAASEMGVSLEGWGGTK